MQQFLYYGGLENADYNPMFKKQSGNGFDPERLPKQKFRLQPRWGDDETFIRAKKLSQLGFAPQTGGKRRRKKKQRGGAAPRRTAAPVRAAPKPSLWQRAKGFIKDNKLVSRGLNELASLAGKYETFAKYQPYLQGAKTIAELKGWGKKKRGKK